MTTHAKQLQQYTRPTNNNYTQDNLKVATKHTRQIRILHVKKAKHSSKTVLCTVCFNYSFPIINSLTLSPQSFTSHHLLLLQTFSIKTPPPFPILHFFSPHSTSVCFVHFTSFYFTSLHFTLDNFSLHF